ncbi:MAG: type II secretion system F family protein [Candidatus Wallbacteria bacterium]|nr:type II secretion system F family protein [Candidatus Wallbacteria bacterium]
MSSLLPLGLGAIAVCAAFWLLGERQPQRGAPDDSDSHAPDGLVGLLSPLERPLRQAGLEVTPAGFCGLAAVACAAGDLAGWLLAPGAPLLALAGAAAGAAAPFVWLLRQASARARLFESQLLPTVVQLSEALAAGRSFQDALAVVARTGRPPMARELARTVDDLEHGVPLESAMRAFRDRVDSEDVAFFVAGVMLQRQAGGSLAELLDGIAQTLRQRFALRDLVRSLSAQGRLSGLLLSLLPVGIGMYMYWLVPNHISKLWTFAEPGSFRNCLPLLLCFLSEAIGFLWIRKLATIEY